MVGQGQGAAMEGEQARRIGDECEGSVSEVFVIVAALLVFVAINFFLSLLLVLLMLLLLLLLRAI